MAATETDLAGAEQRARRAGCALLDRSERGKLALTGAGAVEFLNGQVTNELADLRAGEGRYAAFLTHKGKMLGDLRILAVAADPAAGDGAAAGEGAAGGDRKVNREAPARAPAALLLDTERVALQALFDMIRRFKVGFDVELHKRTLQLGLLSLLGPNAESVVGGERLAREEHANGPLAV